jgi:hypothetical protein
VSALTVASVIGIGAAAGVAVHQNQRLLPGTPSAPAEPSSTSSYETGGYLVNLRHSGEQTIEETFGLLAPSRTFDVSGTATRELTMSRETPDLPAISVAHVVIDDSGVVRPRRALEVTAESGLLWRLELAVFFG